MTKDSMIFTYLRDRNFTQDHRVDDEGAEVPDSWNALMHPLIPVT